MASARNAHPPRSQALSPSEHGEFGRAVAQAIERHQLETVLPEDQFEVDYSPLDSEVFCPETGRTVRPWIGVVTHVKTRKIIWTHVFNLPNKRTTNGGSHHG